MLIALLIPLILASILFASVLARSAIVRGAIPRVEAVALGAVANFFDTLGIGSFAPTIAWFKFRAMVADRLMPPTMLVGYTLPSLAEAIIFLILLGVFVDPALLVGCVLAVLMGAVSGAPLVAKSRVWVVQTIVGFALLLAACFYALTNLGLLPHGGTAASLPPPPMVAAIAANFVFGVLLNFGVGNYAPSLAMFSLKIGGESALPWAPNVSLGLPASRHQARHGSVRFSERTIQAGGRKFCGRGGVSS